METETPTETPQALESPSVQHFLSIQQFADRLGHHRGSLVRAKLPPPDAYIGKIRGWLPETIDAWQARKPGKGSRDPSWYLPEGMKHLAPPQKPRGAAAHKSRKTKTDTPTA